MPYKKTYFWAHNWARITLIGIFLFFVLYGLAAAKYPGGSNFNSQEAGYHFTTNYWCELLGDYAKNGHPNTSRPFGIIGMIVLAFAVSNFWYFIASHLPLSPQLISILRVTGVFSMVCSLFIFNYMHDAFIALSVLFGLIAFGLVSAGLYKLRKTYHFFGGLTCMILIVLNCTMYVQNLYIDYLPGIQKVSFLFVLFWIAALTAHVSREEKSSRN